MDGLEVASWTKGMMDVISDRFLVVDVEISMSG